MKKLLCLLAATLFVVAAFAQPKALGVRFGFNGVGNAELSYEHYMDLTGSENEFLETELGLYGTNGFKLTGMYNWTVWQPAWTDRGDWGLYLGPGVGLGYGTYKKDEETHSSILVDFVAQVGMEYTFWFPLQLSLDFRPSIGYLGGFNPHWWGLNLSARYAF